MTPRVLVINSGSSSIKYQLVDTSTSDVLAVGLVERIATGSSGILQHTNAQGEKTTVNEVFDNHEVGLTAVLDMFATHGPDLTQVNLVAVGHRVVQGGNLFNGPVVITDEIQEQIAGLSPLAPLHNPANLEGIIVARRAFPDLPHVVVFDTAFHTTLEPAAYTYAIDREVAKKYSIRRYGAHGTSHKFVSERAAEMLGKTPDEANVIVLHVGNGASATAVKSGKSIETSMGLTPLEGLVMGTRTGDIDPAVVFHLERQAGMTTDELDTLFNKRSGLLGMTGYSDARDVHDAIARGEEAAQIGLDVFCHRIKHYVGAYYAQLGRVDAIIFTAGIGENDDIIRLNSLSGLEHMGIVMDAERNAGRIKEPKEISADGSPVKVFVIPTNEELEIARQALELIGSPS